MKELGFLGVLAAACGGSNAKPGPDAANTACKDMGGSACFNLPTGPMTNRNGMASALGCGAFVPTPAPSPVTFTGTVKVFGQSVVVPNASIKVYSSVDYATPVATATSAADGTYSLTVPTGTPNQLFGDFEAANYLSVYPHYVRANLSMGNISMYALSVVTSDIIDGASLLVKENWDPTSAVFAGTALDCDGVIVEHAEVVLSATAGQRDFVPGVSVYYGAAGAVPLAVPPDQRADTNDNGAFAIYHLKEGAPYYVQMWGFIDQTAQAQGEAGLTMVAEEQIHVVTNTAGNVALWAH